MKIIRVGVLDDEQNAVDIISTSVKKIFSSNGVEAEIVCFTSAKELWLKLKEEWFNLLFLDIKMPLIDGVEFGKKIAAMENRPDIVFVSSNTNRVFDTFAVNPFGFVRKDNFIKDLSGVIERYVKQKVLSGENKLLQIEVKNRGEFISVNLSLVKYIECVKNVQTLYMDGLKNCEVHSRIYSLEEQVTSYGFIRIHKGYLVNCKYIRRFNATTVQLTTGEELPVGRSKRDEAMDKYFEYMRANGISIIG